MDFFGKILDVMSGGFGGKVADKVLGLLPDNLSEKEKAAIHVATLKAEREFELQLLRVANEEQQKFNDRLKDLEGTADDLKAFGFVGRFVVLLRGAQRPVWGFAVLGMDFMVFSGQWDLSQLASEVAVPGDMMGLDSAFWLINFLVLGFLFGERAMRNVLPLIGGLKARGV